MSRNVARIEKALAAKGYEFIAAWYEPLGGMREMEGPEGGWTVEYHDGSHAKHIFGRCVDEVLENIESMSPRLRGEGPA